MLWKGIKGKFVNVKSFFGNIYPSYFEFIWKNGFNQDGFQPGNFGPDEKYRFEWLKIYSSFDKETKEELAIIQKVINGRLHKYVIKESALQDIIVESIFRYNNIWEELK